jgi:uncharacterized protein YyaL (SSP411 family)
MMAMGSSAYAVSKPREIAPVGDLDSPDTQVLLDVVRDRHRPSQVVALGAPGAQTPAVPLPQDRGLVEGPGEHAHAAVYVCHDFVCQAPVTEREGLQGQLERR